MSPSLDVPKTVSSSFHLHNSPTSFRYFCSRCAAIGSLWPRNTGVYEHQWLLLSTELLVLSVSLRGAGLWDYYDVLKR